MKRTRKYIAALAVIAAGSVFYGSLPAHAKSIEPDKEKLVFRHEGARGHMPPPPPERHEYRRHVPPSPEHRELRGPRGPRYFEPRRDVPPHHPPVPRHRHREDLPPPHHR